MSHSNHLKGALYIVIGGAGYIGSHVCQAIAAHGGEVIVFDNFSSGHKWAVKWGEYVNVDLRDQAEIAMACQTYRKAKAVIHLASAIEVGLGECQPAEFYSNNVLGAFNLLEAMRSVDLNTLIFSSSCAIYGDVASMPLTESSPQHPLSVYGKTKLAIEHMIQSYHKAYGLNYITLRYFNAAGADPRSGIGEAHDPETHLIPLALAAVAGVGTGLKIFGTDYDTLDGTCIRDYIHVSDIALAHIKGIQKLMQGLSAAEVNIGTGQGYSNLELVQMIEHVTGQNLSFEAAPRRAGDVSQLYADPSKATKLLGFTPRHSTLENIIRTAWQFHKQVWRISD